MERVTSYKCIANPKPVAPIIPDTPDESDIDIIGPIIGGVVGGIVLIIIMTVISWYCCCKKKNKNQPIQVPVPQKQKPFTQPGETPQPVPCMIQPQYFVHPEMMNPQPVLMKEPHSKHSSI